MGDEKRKQSADFVSKWECSSLIITRFYSVILILCGKRFFFFFKFSIIIIIIVIRFSRRLCHCVYVAASSYFLLLNCSRYASNCVCVFFLALYTRTRLRIQNVMRIRERKRDNCCLFIRSTVDILQEDAHTLYSMFTYWFTQLE